MRRLPLVVLVAGALAVPLLPAAPAYAAGSVLCVQSNDASCTSHPATITAALALASVSNEDDLVLVGAGTFTEPPLNLNPGGHALVLRGAGQGVTVFTVAPGPVQSYIIVNDAQVEDLTVKLSTTTANGDAGLQVSGSLVQRVTVDTTGTDSTTALRTVNSTIKDSSFVGTVDAASGTVGAFVETGNTITDSVFTASIGISASMDPGGMSTVSRVSITAKSSGIALDGGTVNVDDTVVDLGTHDNAIGLDAGNPNGGTTPMVFMADHVTIVGGGAGSVGALADATALTAGQDASITLHNSILRGPSIDLQAVAVNGGAPLPTSHATVVATYTNWHSSQEGASTGGTASVTATLGQQDVNPQFTNPAAGNFRPRFDSPLIDKGDPAAGGPATDRDGNARIFDGDAVAGAVRDLGAYELVDVVPPHTVITSGPSGPTNDATPTFGFSSEPGATFLCLVDDGTATPCSSPFTTTQLNDGLHQFRVVATDLVGHLEAAPARLVFTVDTVAPDTRITKKPSRRTTHARIKVKFPWIDSGTPRFECRLDQRAFAPCTSPFKVKVKVGKHTIEVRAIDAAGNVDPTPARVKFRRVPKK